MRGTPFLKMHGLGNDFVVLDARGHPLAVDAAVARAIADRHTGIGCDQLIVIAESDRADAFMGIWNPDGSRSGACGNATRCVAALLFAGLGRNSVSIETDAGVLEAVTAEDGNVTVDMGPARLDWTQIPLAGPADTLNLPIRPAPGLTEPVAVGVGNPHAVFFVDDVAAVPLDVWGPRVERDPMFPEGTNVSFVQVLPDGALRTRVWERGAGATRACGSAACAVVVAASRRGLVPRKAPVLLPGGRLDVEWDGRDHMMMTGPVALSFSGMIGDLPIVTGNGRTAHG